MTMTEAVLAKHLGRLQLPYFVQHAPDLMTQAARESWSHGRFLEGLVAGEVARRDEALIARRIQAARLPGIKTLDGFDWSWPKKINRAQISICSASTSCRRMQRDSARRGRRRQDPSGHSPRSCGLSAGPDDAVHHRRRHCQCAGRRPGHWRVKREMARLLKPPSLCVDELGYLPIDKFGADGLFQVISQRYERGSTIITSNKAYKQWPEIFNNDSTLTAALLDRLLHHAETLVIEGSSYRMREQHDA
jgi:DNA replication protein DnaC